jgi:pyruvate formate-lyase/glycerol dehydratase family glycyl radical enzyme
MLDYATLPVSERIQRLKDELFNCEYTTCYHRGRLLTESYQQTEGEHSALRRAKALRHIFARMPLFVRDGELLVGHLGARLNARPIYPEYHLNGLTQEATPPEIWNYWRGRTLGEETRALHPDRLRAAERERASGWCTGTSSGFGHVIVDYEKALRIGFNGIIAQARELLASASDEDREGIAFLNGVIIAAEGIILWATRYADLADEMARVESDPARARELETIAETCRRVPAEPARNLREAMQAFWFVHAAMHIEQQGWSISAGRLDQYLLPYHSADLEDGELTQEDAWELLLSLWIKFNENTSPGRRTTFQNLTLGGQDEEGRDACNALSHLCLDATIALHVHQPALSVRWHPGIDPAFWGRVQLALAQGTGLPALFNDEVIIPALVEHGVAPDDAMNYGIVGCVEACVSGKMQGVTAGGHLNVAKALELALNGGRSMLTGDLVGEPTGDPREFQGFDDLWDAYVAQVEYLSGLAVLASIIAGEGQKRRGHCPLMSSLLDDCLARRRDLVFGGTRYNLPGVAIYGSTNVYDGLCAIRRCVCEEGLLTWPELHQALVEDYSGHENIARMLANRAPRFGNDELVVDELANRVNAVHAEFFWKHVDSRNGRFTCGVWPVEGHVSAGRWIAATPDGRLSGAPLVDGVGACQGADRSGPTALLRSVARLDNIWHWSAGNTCNLKVAASALRSSADLDRMRDLVTTFMDMGGQELQINVVDAATLRAAQANPADHAELIVRVAGFSAYFVELGRATQDEIISRTEHMV